MTEIRVAFPVAVALTTALANAQPCPLPIQPDCNDARAIMTAVERRDRGDRTAARLRLTIYDRQGAPRVRTLQLRSMRFPTEVRRLAVIESPPDLRGVALLTFDHDDGKRPDDQWLYLPGLKKRKRILPGHKADRLLGSDLTYGDLTDRDPDQYSYEMLEASARIGDEECWHLRSVPTTESERRSTGSLRTELWISKSRLLPLQTRSWMVDGDTIKSMEFADIRQDDGIWIAHRWIVRTVTSGQEISTTELLVVEPPDERRAVTEADFTEAAQARGL